MTIPLGPVSEDPSARQDWRRGSRFAATGIAVCILWPVLSLRQGFALALFSARSNACSRSDSVSPLILALALLTLGFLLATTLIALHISAMNGRSAAYAGVAVAGAVAALVAIGLSAGPFTMAVALSPDSVPGLAMPSRIVIGTLPFWPGLGALGFIGVIYGVRSRLQLREGLWKWVGAFSVPIVCALAWLVVEVARSGC